MDEGTGPDRASNPGGNPDQILLEDLNERIDRADYDSARSTVRAVLDSPILGDFRASPRGDLPVGVLDPQVREWIGASTFLVHLSYRVMHKQDGRHPSLAIPGHPELTLDDYRRLPKIIECPDFVFRAQPFRQIPRNALDRRLSLVRQVDGRIYHLVVERARTARKVEVVSFHRLTAPKVRARLERAEVFRPEDWTNRDWTRWQRDCAW